MCLFSLVAYTVFPLSLVFSNLILIHHVVFLMFLLPELIKPLESVVFSIHQIWKFFDHYFFNYIFYPTAAIWISNYSRVRGLDIISNLIDVLFVFPPLIFSMGFILDVFNCYVFKFTDLFLLFLKKANLLLIQCIFLFEILYFFISGNHIWIFFVTSVSLLLKFMCFSVFLNM